MAALPAPLKENFESRTLRSLFGSASQSAECTKFYSLLTCIRAAFPFCRCRTEEIAALCAGNG